MRAVVVHEFGPIGSARVEEIAAPEPSAGQVQIAVAFAPVNFVDTLVLQGTYQFLPPRPFVPGKGPVGTVTKVGSAVTGLQVGDRVLAMAEQGGYGEYACADADQCHRLPDGMPFEVAASISLAFDTAWMALTDRARIAPGDTVLVLGATGAVGSAAIQLAKALGARVIAGVSSPAKIEAVRESGATDFVDLSAANLRDSLREQVHALTSGRGADIVIDPIGGEAFGAALRAMAWRGRLVVIGFASGTIPTLKANYLLLKNIEVSGLQISDYRKKMPQAVRKGFERIFEFYSDGKIWTPPVAKYALGDYARALEDLVSRRAAGRVVLTMEG